MILRPGSQVGTGVETPSRWRSVRGLVTALVPRLGRAVVGAVIASVPVGLLAAGVHWGWAPLIDLDTRLVDSATAVTREHPGLRSGLLWWQEAFVPWKVFALTVPALVWAYVRGLRGRAIWAAVTLLAGWGLRLGLSLIVQRMRPQLDDPIATVLGYSFPSGHAFSAAFAVLVCLVLVWPLLGRSTTAKAALVTLGALFVAVQVLDRVFLGVHYPSDVTAGMLFALALGWASWIGFTHGPDNDQVASRSEAAATGTPQAPRRPQERP